MEPDLTASAPPEDWDAGAFAAQLGAPTATPGTEDPGGLAASLATARASMVGDPPAMSPPSDGEVTLCRGLSNDDEWQRVAYMREVTGADEEALSRFDLGKAITQFTYWDTLLARTTIRVGNIDIENLSLGARQQKLGQLLLGDRESMYLGLIRATWGDVRTIEGVGCPHCGHVTDYGLALTDTDQHKSDFPSQVLEDPDQVYFEVKLRKGDTIEVRLPTGADMAALSAMWKNDPTPAERNTQMLGRLIYTYNGTPVKDPVAFAKGLASPDRQTVTAFIVDKQPGPRLGGVMTSCASCEETFFLELGLARLLQLAT